MDALRCPRCHRESSDPIAAFCRACGAPLRLAEEPAAPPLTAPLAIDRRGADDDATPVAPLPLRPRTAPPQPSPRAAPPPSAEDERAALDRSHWELGAPLPARAEPAPAERNVARPPVLAPPRAAPIPARPAPAAPPAAAIPPRPAAAAPPVAAIPPRPVPAAPPDRPRSPLPQAAPGGEGQGEGAAAPRAPAISPAEAASPHAPVATPPSPALPTAAPAPSRAAARPAPRAPAAGGVVEVHVRRAEPWRRACAWAVDGVPFAAAGVALARLFVREATAGAGLPAPGLDLLDFLARERVIVLSVAAAAAVALAVYATLAHALAGATLGKRALRIRVVGPDGERPGLARSAARTALAVLSAGALGLGFLLALFTPSGRALHDLAARTWVVDAQP